MGLARPRVGEEKGPPDLLWKVEGGDGGLNGLVRQVGSAQHAHHSVLHVHHRQMPQPGPKQLVRPASVLCHVGGCEGVGECVRVARVRVRWEGV